MIRQTDAAAFDAAAFPFSEAAVKIGGLLTAYGDRPFLRLWQGGGGFLALSGGGAVLCASDEADGEEWGLFLTMQPEIERLRTDAFTAKRLSAGVLSDWTPETGAVMTPGKALLLPGQAPVPLEAREVYPLLAACFAEGLPPFDAWYADVSHRLRHGCCRIAGFREKERVLSSAMTTAETRAAALIGAVATLPEARGRGYASANVLALAHALAAEERRVLLSPKNADARALYARIGFVECGGWGELSRVTPKIKKDALR